MEQIVLNGNNIDLLKNYPDNHFDAVVTDPPYGLGKEPNAEALMRDWVEKGYHEVKGSGFMGKEWDAFIPQPIFWKEVFRVLKHGGHVVSFFGTRTYDWGVMAMRFAGFEVRDCIQWLYGSGFPKSHNISKGIDNQDTREFKKNVGLTIKNNRIKSGLTMDELCDKLKLNNQGHGGMVNHYENGRATPTIEIWKDICEILNISEIEDYDEQKKGRLKEIGKVKNPISWFGNGIIKEVSTEEAKQWKGWGSALKPANEPIVLARKPLEKGLSIAENVLKWGTGGINIDGCRVSSSEDMSNIKAFGSMPTNKSDSIGFSRPWMNDRESILEKQNAALDKMKNLGRFPANLILTHHPECECKGFKKVKGSNCTPADIGKGRESEISDLGDIFKFKESKVFSSHTDENGEETIEDWDCHEDCPIRIMDEQSGVSKTGDIKPHKENSHRDNGDFFKSRQFRNTNFKGDSGGASRFFYVAKASKSERNKGLEGFEEKQTIGGGGTYNEEAAGKYGSIKAEAKNFHPTVKPIKLMQYLARLITPPNGKVLDPFCGSGTTGIACKLEGFEFVGMEQDPEYTKIAQARIENYKEEKEGVKQREIKKDEPLNDELNQLTLF
jgi:DNA modification methylase